ncbi:MAG TPA: DUF2100 domain-containing protein [Methanobacteriaceae archaeon]|nr:DUF2100 domain-containing protein [Methanobacteriaceae archaeon]
MEKSRLKQAQALLKKAGNSSNTAQTFKNPKKGKIDSKIYSEILNQLLESEEFIYTSRPEHELSLEEAQIFCGQLLEIRNKIDSLLADFGVLEMNNQEDEVKKLSLEFIFLTPKANFKKLLIKWGVDPQRIVVAGVPLQIEDMKILNPKIPDQALGPIKKKIQHVINDLDRKIELYNPKKVLVLIEEDQAGEILAKRAEKLYSSITLQQSSVKDMEVQEFLKILGSC